MNKEFHQNVSSLFLLHPTNLQSITTKAAEFAVSSSSLPAPAATLAKRRRNQNEKSLGLSQVSEPLVL